MINYQRFECSDALRPYVQYYWELHYEGEEPYIHLQLPDACAELLFNFGGEFHEILDGGKRQHIARAALQPPADQPTRFQVSRSFSLFGAYLYPYTATMLFGGSVHGLKNVMVDFTSLLGCEGRVLENKMTEAMSTFSRIAIISDFLLRQIDRCNCGLYNMDVAVRRINLDRGNFSVANLAFELNVSVRQLERRFKAVSGFSPKEYGKIIRFRSAIEVLHATKTSLADTALALGYYDQAHFSNDFKALSGYAPNEFIRNSENEKSVYTA